MDKRKWAKIKELFNAALELEPKERDSFVFEQAGRDQDLFQHVIRMLEAGIERSEDGNEISRIVDANAAQFLDVGAKLAAGDRIDEFKIVAPIGEGGMGSVFLAERENADFHQLVAIKVIHQRMLGQLNEQRFKLERQILASLQHPNIAGFIGGGQTPQGYPYIILEYIDGVSINEYCEKKTLSVEQILDLFQQVLDAVTYSHQNLVVHRDIKPSNVLVTEDGNVKLLDFGIAKLLEDENSAFDSQKTQTFVRVLTHSNAAPEQVLGEAVTTSTDVYGLGSLLMQLLTNTPVFDHTQTTQRELEEQILEQTPLKPSSRCKVSQNIVIKSRFNALKGDLDTIVLKALNKDAQKRYASVEALAHDIQCYRANYPILARPPSRWYGLAKFLQRNKLSSSLAGTLIVGLVGFTVVVSYQTTQIQIQRDRAIEQALIAQETTRYLTDIFVSADPNVNDGEVLSASSLIDEAYQSALKLGESPAIKAELLIVLASVYRQISEVDKAVVLIQDVQTLIQNSIIKQQELQRLDVMSSFQRASLDVLKGDYQSAIVRFEQNLEYLNGLGEVHNLDIRLYQLLNLYGLGNAYVYTRQGEKSLLTYERIIDLSENSQYEEEFTSSAYFGLGDTLRYLSRFEESKTFMLKGLALNEKYDSTPTLDFAHGLNQLASTLLQLGEYDDALKYAKSGLEIRQDIYDGPNIEVAASMGMVANILATQRNFDAAIETRLNMLGLVEQTVGREHPFYPIVKSVIGRLYLLAGKNKQAEIVLNEALTQLYTISPEGSVNSIIASLELSVVYYLNSNYSRATRYLEQAKKAANQHLEDSNNYRFSIIQAYEALIAWRLNTITEEDLQGALTSAIDDFTKTYNIETEQYKNLITRLELMQ